MSTIILQFGQCGNQIGRSLYNVLEEDIKLHKSEPLMLNKWFNINKKNEWEPRTILVDTESKVINTTKSLQTSFKYKNIVARSLGGSANNWAFGYFTNGKQMVSDVLNCVQSELEKSDFLTSFLCAYSLSGGTGSGVGSCILEMLHNDYPKKTISCCAVLPCLKAEISIQSYNTILNLSHLYSVSDNTMLFENEKLLYLCNLDNKDVCFQNINKIICNQIASVHQPINNVDNFNILNNLTAHPNFKFLTVKSEPQQKASNLKHDTSQSWLALTRSIIKESRFDLALKNAKKSYFKPKIVSNGLITRGVDILPENSLKGFKDIKDYVKWVPKEEQFKSYHQNLKFLDNDKYMTLISNSSNICVPLELIVVDAWNLFTHGAYLHHYAKFGMDEDEFLKSFQVMENILESYKNI